MTGVQTCALPILIEIAVADDALRRAVGEHQLVDHAQEFFLIDARGAGRRFARFGDHLLQARIGIGVRGEYAVIRARLTAFGLRQFGIEQFLVFSTPITLIIACGS